MTTKIQSSPLTRKTTYKRLIFNCFKELLTRFYWTAMKLKIESDWFRDRNEALDKLKSMAAYLNYKYIVEVRFNKDMGSEPSENGKGTHYYTVWQAMGYVVK